MTRRVFVPLIASAAGASDGVSVALIETSEGDHLPYYRRLASRAGVGRFANSDVAGAAKMIREARPVLVAISVQPEATPEAVELALRGGAHVVVEKPGCTKPEQFEHMARVARESGRNLMLAMATRCDPAAMKARELMRRGWIGKVYGASMTWVADQTRLHNPAYQKTWKVSKVRGGGGKLIFHGIHYLDLLRDLTELRVRRVNAFTGIVGGAPSEVEDAAAVSMEMENGAMATLNTGYYLDKGYDNELKIWGSSGWLRFRPHGEVTLEWYSTHGDAPRGVQQFRPLARESVYDLMFQSAVDAAAGKGPWFTTTEESLEVLRLVFAAYRSAGTGQSVLMAGASERSASAKPR